MARIGLRDLYYAKIISDGPAGTVYDVPKKMAPAMSTNLNPSLASGSLYGDDAIVATAQQITGISLTLGTTSLETAVENDLLGKATESDGGTSDSANDNPPDVAVGWRTKLSSDEGNGYEYCWILKTKFGPYQEQSQTKDNNVTFGTPSLQGVSSMRASDLKWRHKIRTTDPGVDQNVINNWFNAVQDGVGHAAVTGLSVNPTSATLGVNGKLQLSAVIAPLDAGNKKINYSSSDPAIATVDSVGIVTGVAAGTATITATTAEGNFTDTCAVTVA